MADRDIERVAMRSEQLRQIVDLSSFTHAGDTRVGITTNFALRIVADPR
jgi:hypothetical protein